MVINQDSFEFQSKMVGCIVLLCGLELDYSGARMAYCLSAVNQWEKGPFVWENKWVELWESEQLPVRQIELPVIPIG